MADCPLLNCNVPAHEIQFGVRTVDIPCIKNQVVWKQPKWSTLLSDKRGQFSLQRDSRNYTLHIKFINKLILEKNENSNWLVVLPLWGAMIFTVNNIIFSVSRTVRWRANARRVPFAPISCFSLTVWCARVWVLKERRPHSNVNKFWRIIYWFAYSENVE